MLPPTRPTGRNETPDRILESRIDKRREKKLLEYREAVFSDCMGVLHLRPYLEQQKFIFRTDHHSLRWVLNLSDAQGRLARWRLRLLEFDYEVQYHPGALHHGADTMSRLRSEDPVVAEPTDEIDTEVPCFALAHSPLVTGREELCGTQPSRQGKRERDCKHNHLYQCTLA